MKLKPSFLLKLAGLTLCSLSLIQDVKAQPFAYNPNDVFIGFRKTGANQGSYELVVNIGQATNYIAMTLGSVSNIANFSPAQLSDAFSNYNNLNFSVSGGQDGGPPPSGYPGRTIWLTAPRINVNVQSTPIQRDSVANQLNTTGEIISVLGNAAILSSGGSSNQDNNAVLVREPAGDPSAYSAFVSGQSDSTISTYQDTLKQSIEVVTPASFTSPVRADFYEVRPTTFLDPHTGLTSGNAYYAGYFQLNTDGTMSFTRASTGSTPPPAPVLKITRSGAVNTVSFGTTNGATYTLYLTNSAGLAQPVANWPSFGSLTGNGNTNSFMDTTTDLNRFYTVIAH
jgi:hypothetical protein